MEIINPNYPKKIVLAGAMGGAIEFYDLTLYGILATFFAPLFFPAENEIISLLSAYGVFAIGFFARPLGALLFGWVGDKLGRKVALVWSLMLMSLATLIIGLLPTYAVIGIWAPILMVFSRIIQGVSAGGEYSGALILAIEHGSKKSSGLIGSSITSGCMFGLVLGSIAGLMCDYSDAPVWVWRIPFIVGFFISIIGLYIRFKIAESPEFINHNQIDDSNENVFKVAKRNFGNVLSVLILSGFNGIAIYVYLVFMPSYVAEVTNIPKITSQIYTCYGTVVLMSMLLFFGWLSDHVQRRNLIALGALLTSIIGSLIFYYLPSMPSQHVLMCQLIFVVVLGMYSGPLNTYIIELFKTSVRYRCAALGYSLGMGIIGGSAPFVASLILHSSYNTSFLALYLGINGLLSLISLWWLRTHHDADVAVREISELNFNPTS